MDEISQLRFEDSLPSIINGHLRNAIIRQYQIFKGDSYVPDIVPDTLKWTKSDPMNILKVQTDTPWCLIEKKNLNIYLQQAQLILTVQNHLNKRQRLIRC